MMRNLIDYWFFVLTVIFAMLFGIASGFVVCMIAAIHIWPIWLIIVDIIIFIAFIVMFWEQGKDIIEKCLD